VTTVRSATVNGLPPARNSRAVASVVVGILAVAEVPLAVFASSFLEQLTLLQACASAALAALLGVLAILLARRGRETLQRTLGRSGGGAAARTGKLLGVIALWIAITTGLALGFYGLLTLFAD
jgi:hypothetical protein